MFMVSNFFTFSVAPGFCVKLYTIRSVPPHIGFGSPLTLCGAPIATEQGLSPDIRFWPQQRLHFVFTPWHGLPIAVMACRPGAFLRGNPRPRSLGAALSLFIFDRRPKTRRRGGGSTAYSSTQLTAFFPCPTHSGYAESLVDDWRLGGGESSQLPPDETRRVC